MDLLAQLLTCLRFFSRLPLPTMRQEAEIAPAGLARATAMVPVSGAIIGLVPAIVLVGTRGAGLPPALAAPLALAALLAATGALHEDGLADCADGFGGGRTRARKLEIMRDSRIGTFGACALALSLYSRALALGEIAAQGSWRVAAIVVVAASLSRTACLFPLLLLPPARVDGLGLTAGRPSGVTVATAFVIAIGLSFIALPFGVSLTRLCCAIGLAIVGALAVCGLAWRQIGGQTGDVAGLAQQIAEIAVLLVFASG